MINVKVEQHDGKLYTYTPYNRNFVARAKTIGGRWDPAEKAWYFNERDKELALNLLSELFGYTQTTEQVADVEIHIKAGQQYYDFDDDFNDFDSDGTLIVANRPIAWRKSRNAAVALADGVVLKDGKFPSSAGSAKYPHIWDHDIENDVTLLIHDFPLSSVEKISPGFAPVVLEKSIDVEGLKVEKEKLLARLKEIDELLASVEK